MIIYLPAQDANLDCAQSNHKRETFNKWHARGKHPSLKFVEFTFTLLDDAQFQVVITLRPLKGELDNR